MGGQSGDQRVRSRRFVCGKPTQVMMMAIASPHSAASGRLYPKVEYAASSVPARVVGPVGYASLEISLSLMTFRENEVNNCENIFRLYERCVS